MNKQMEFKIKEAAERYATGNHVVSFADTVEERAFIAGARFAYKQTVRAVVSRLEDSALGEHLIRYYLGPLIDEE